MRDPKLGYHWIWIVPLGFTVMIVFYTLWPFAWLYKKAQHYLHKLKLYIIYKRNPEIKALAQQAGTHNV